MSGIQMLDSLSGKISGQSVLRGTLSGSESMNGSICVTKEHDTYSGEYKVVPKAHDSNGTELEDSSGFEIKGKTVYRKV